jgi:hypothetical protein
VWAGGTIVGVLFGLPKIAIERYEWYMDRFRDQPVKAYLFSLVTIGGSFPAGRAQWASAKGVFDIARATGRSERSVKKSLNRLEKKREVCREPGSDTWKANIPSYR